MANNHHEILGVARNAGPAELRRAFRARAFELHPDRNGGSPEAEAAFKELVAAYAALSGTPRAGPRGPRAGSATDDRIDPRDLFADLARDPLFGDLLAQLSRDFSRQGLRFDEGYLRRMFAGRGHGGLVFGGVVFFGPLQGLFRAASGAGRERSASSSPADSLPRSRPGLLGRLFRKALPAAAGRDLDLQFSLEVSAELLSAGGPLQMAVPGDGGTRRYTVRVPANSRPGTRLRLAGRGKRRGDRVGDLYLELRAGG